MTTRVDSNGAGILDPDRDLVTSVHIDMTTRVDSTRAGILDPDEDLVPGVHRHDNQSG